MIADHKEIAKMNGQLNTLIGSLKLECGKVVTRVKESGDFSEIWEKDAGSKLREFTEHDPSLAEFHDQIKYYHVSLQPMLYRLCSYMY